MSDWEICRICQRRLQQGSQGDLCPHCLKQIEIKEYENRQRREKNIGRSDFEITTDPATTHPATPPPRETIYWGETIDLKEKVNPSGQTLTLTFHAGQRPSESGTTEEGEHVERRFGGYLLIKELGRGGMGVVYEAIQLNLNRPVALKRIRYGSFAVEKDLLRFQGEAEVIATLDHPNIVPIYEVGEHEGECYFSMKLFEGKDLRSRLSEFRGQPRAIARLVATIADAVQYAHQRGILHRDLKPSNILLDSLDQPHLIDFGLAMRLVPGEEPASVAIAGTPNFMAPEQAAGIGGATTLSDVYGLGGILYSLLTGVPPFQAGTTEDLLKTVIEQEPIPPSELARGIDRDLEVICLKSLAKDPGLRYATAKEVSDDLKHWLAGEPIRARPHSVVERAVMLARRQPALATLWAGFTAAVILGLIGIVAAMLVAQHHERLAVAREQEAHRQAYLALIRLGARDYRDANIGHLQEILKETQPSNGRADLRGFEWYYLKSLCSQDLLTLKATNKPLKGLDFHPDGSRLVVVGGGVAAQSWDTSTGKLIHSLPSEETETRSVSFHPNGREFATASRNGEVKLWDVATGQLVREFVGLNGRALEVVFSPDGTRFIAGGDQGKVVVWETASGKLLQDLKGHSPTSAISNLAYSADGKSLASSADDNSVKLWDPVNGQLVKSLDGFKDLPRCLDFNDDGSKLAIGVGSQVVIFSTGDWSRIREFRGELTNNRVIGLDFNRDGTMLVTVGYDQVVRVWETSSGTLLRSFKGHIDTIYDVKFHPKLPQVASVDGLGNVKLWSLEDEQDPRRFLGHNGRVTDIRFSPTGTWFASASEDGTVQMWESATGKRFRTLSGHQGTVSQISISNDGARLASVGLDKTLRVFEVSTGKLLQQANEPGDLHCVSFGPNGKLLAFAGEGRDIKLWDVDRGRVVRTLQGHVDLVVGLSFSPDGSRLASCGKDSRILIWDVASGKMVGPNLVGVDEGRIINCVVFSPDGRWLATAARNGLIRLWDSRSGELALTLQGHMMESVNVLAFSPDGRRIASNGDDCLRLWDVEMGRELMSFEPYEVQGRAIAFSPDGKTLLSGSSDPIVRGRGYKNSP